jgi:hypothetical protein
VVEWKDTGFRWNIDRAIIEAGSKGGFISVSS